MKIFTFDATQDTRVEILWSLKSQNRDEIFARYIAQNTDTEVKAIEDCNVAIYPYKAFTPETLVFNKSVYSAARLAKAHDKPLVIDATSDSDVLLDIPSADILRCGLYKSLQKPFETECPYWSNDRTKRGLDALDINIKGQKPVVGFCGTTSSIGKLANLSKRWLPKQTTELALSKGKIARRIDPRIVEGMSLQLRETAMKIIAADTRLETAFDVTNNHQSYYIKNEANKIALENLFITNTSKADYVLCVRGSGNYSGRFYMALNAGRIPIVIDTDVVIPYEDRLNIIKVPIRAIASLGDIVLDHFNSTTATELRMLKLQNRRAYHQYLAPEQFLPNYLVNCAKPLTKAMTVRSKAIAFPAYKQLG